VAESPRALSRRLTVADLSPSILTEIVTLQLAQKNNVESIMPAPK
jgi:hypothetical protein